MDSQTKFAIKSLVLGVRHMLEDELAIVVRRYGLFTDRDWSLEEPPTQTSSEPVSDLLGLLRRIVSALAFRRCRRRCASRG
jgi:hypothetical protein